MMSTPPLAMLLAILGALPALAEPWACQFTAECLAGMACDESDWQVEIIAADHEGQLFLSSITGNAPATRLTERAYATHNTLVTIAADGIAMLSTHVEVVVTYFGTCEAL